MSIIRSLGALALKEGQVGRATHLYAASASIADEHEFHGSTLLEEHRFEGNVATLRARMGDAAFERIWTEGRAMSLDEAVELGLGQAAGVGMANLPVRGATTANSLTTE